MAVKASWPAMSRESEFEIDRYVDLLRVRGFRPRKEVRYVAAAGGAIVRRVVTVFFKRIGGLPGPIPKGANFRPAY